MSPISFRKNFLWNLVATLANGIARWGIVMSIAKYGSPELVGQFTLATGLVLPVYAFLNLQLRVVYITGRYGAYPFGHYLSLRLLTILFSLFCCGIGALFLRDLDGLFLVVMVYSLLKGVQAVADIFYAPLQKNERINLMSLSMIAKSIGSFFMVILTMAISGKLLLAIFSMLAWEGLFTFIVDRRFAGLYSTVQLIAQKNIIIKLFKESFPVGVATGLTMLNGSVPRFIVEHYRSVQEAGYFGAIQYFFVASSMVIVATNTAAIPRLARFYREQRKKRFYHLVFRLIGVGLFVVFFVVLFFSFFGKLVLEVFYTHEYAAYAKELQVIAVAISLQIPCGVIAGSILSLGKYWHLVFALVAAVATSIIFGMILVRNSGVAGAAYAMVFSSAIQLLLISFFLFHSSRHCWSNNTKG